jgi:phospholipid/cholesterol/gamma-HCH transport system substrate-binding protein
MEGRVNYLLVGTFVALFIAAIFGFAFWLMKYSNYEEMDRYVVYFSESVSGLNKDASVKYMGVDAGIVEDIKVHPQNTQLVAVYLKIKRDIKIKKDMEATLKFYGMTGLAYVEIFGHDPNAPILKPKEGEIPVIPSAPSIFAKLDETLAKLAEEFSVTLQKLSTLLNDKNLQNIEKSIENITLVSNEFESHKSDISALIRKGHLLEERAQETLQKIDLFLSAMPRSLGKEMHNTLREFKTTAKEIKKAIKHMDLTIQRGDYNLKKISKPAIHKLSALMDDLSELSGKMDETLEMIQQSPRDLLFKEQIKKPGPGE